MMRLNIRPAAILAVLISFLIALTARGDKIVLKDGTVLEGTITHEAEGFIWFRHDVSGTAREDLYDLGKVDVERDPQPAQPAGVPAPAPDAPKAVVITLGSRAKDQGDEVGVYITADALKQMVPMLEEELGKDHKGTVVLRVCSGGGILSEIQALSDVIHDEYQTRWHVAAWIDSAISAAAMSVHGIEDIYFTPQGNYGACTGFHAESATKHMSLQALLVMMEGISKRGDHSPLIMRSMQVQVPLSATVDANGEVHFYQDATSGTILVNRPHEILTFNAKSAEEIKFSKGTAATLAELTTRMGRGELNWIGARDAANPWPICKTERWNIDHRIQLNKDEAEADETCANYNMRLQKAESTPRVHLRRPSSLRLAPTLRRSRRSSRRIPCSGSSSST